MERDEIITLLREHLSIDISMNTTYECGRSYVSCSVSLQLDGEEITSDCDSVNIDND